MQGRVADKARFQEDAHVVQVLDPPALRQQVADDSIGGRHRRIVAGTPDHRAESRPAFHQTAAGKRCHSLAHDRSAHSEGFDEIAFRWQRRAIS
jgi:hypothetical protein